MVTAWIRRGGWMILLLIGVAAALFYWRSLTWSGVSALPIAVNNAFAPRWMPLHTTTATAALLIGIFPVLSRLRAWRPSLLRWIERFYLVGCLFAGVSGFVLALGTAAGPIATAGFGTASLLWVFASVRTWQLETADHFPEHRAWLIRSWAITLVGVSLPIDLALGRAAGVEFMLSYRVTAWLCWTGNWAIAELYLARGYRLARNRAEPTAAG